MILILNLPVKEYGQGGRIIQALIKHLWQKEVERRAVPPDGAARPVILICDEAHEFLSDDSGDIRVYVDYSEDELDAMEEYQPAE